MGLGRDRERGAEREKKEQTGGGDIGGGGEGGIRQKVE